MNSAACPSMNVTIISQCYLPDLTGNAVYAHNLAAALQARGHRVTVLASRNGHEAGGRKFAAREFIDGVLVLRLPGKGLGTRTLLRRAVDCASFLMHAAWRIAIGPHSDLVVAITTPPYIGLAARWAARWRGAPLAHWVLDCYPDAIAAALGPRSAAFLPCRIALSALGALSRAQWGPGAKVFTLGPTIAGRLHPYHGNQPAWVPLWADQQMTPWPDGDMPPLRRERGWDHERLVLCYSGNLGRGHRWREFAEAAESLGKSGPLWAFAGGGMRRPQLSQWHAEHRDARLSFLPYAAHDRLREHLCSADVHLISMEAGWEGCIVPSKLQNAFAVGRPVLAVAPENSETARWIRASAGGWVVSPGDVHGVLDALDQAGDARERAKRGQAAMEFAKRHFSAPRNLGLISRLLERGGSAPTAPSPTIIAHDQAGADDETEIYWEPIREIA